MNVKEVNRYAPVVLVFFVCFGAAIVAVIDVDYRDNFMRIADAIVVGFWGWMQQPPRE